MTAAGGLARWIATASIVASAAMLTAEPAELGPPPVLLLTVDTLRADHLSVYGYERETSPNLAAFARDAVVFERAYTTRTKTTPAYASMFTGLAPYRHGLRSLGERLPEEHATLAERLAAAGYETGAFVSSTVMVGRLSGLDQGFDVYEDRLPHREANRANYERLAEFTTAAAARWVARRPRRPFLFLHWIDPHGPYTPPARYADRFRTVESKRIPKGKIPEFQLLGDARDLGTYVDAYDAEIAYTDFEMGRLIDTLRRYGLYDRSLVIFTADHGESLGEDGVYFRHGPTLHDATARVPLLIKPPRSDLRAARRYRGAVSVTDVFATALDYAGLEIPTGLDAVSLRPVVEGLGGDEERVVFSEKEPSEPLRYAAHHRDGSLRAKGACRAQRGRLAPCDVAYFDAEEDPGQRHPIGEGDAYRRLYRALAERRAAMTSFELPYEVSRAYNPTDKEFVDALMRARDGQTDLELDEAQFEGLRRLGYID